MKRLVRFVWMMIFFAGLSLTTAAQTFEENVLYGDEAIADNDFYGAAMYYRNALYLDSTSTKAAWKYAEACRMFNNYTEAAKFYAKVLDRDNTKKYPLCLFWLAMMQKSNGDYVSAKMNFSSFIANYSSQDDYYAKKARVEVEACSLAPKIVDKPLNITIEHLLDAKVNTAYSEFNAIQLGDTALLFSALRPVVAGDIETFIPNTYLSKIYIGWSTQAGWSRVKEMDSKIDDADFHNANITISADQARMFFTRGKMENNPQLQSEILFSENIKGKWQKAIKLNDKINLENYTSTQPALAEMGDYDVLYFVSDRPGGYGKLDIWYSIIKDGKYSDPVNLGSIINTPGDDITPFYRDSILYFSSDWHKGLGGFDIFKSIGGLNQWTQPENMGYPLNTSYNDIYFTINTVDNDGYFTSNRPGSLYIKSETCCNDIYYYEWKPLQNVAEVVEVVEVKDTIDLEESIRMLLPLTLYFHNDEPDARSQATSTKKNYQTTLSEYYDMKETYKEEYAKGLTGFEKIKAEKDIEDFFENYVGRGFAQLKLFSKLLLTDLERGSRVQIMIKGYCSPLTSTEYNVNLAKRRISSLKNYIYQYNEGVFLPYLDSTAANGGKLIILEDPIGESTSSPFVSDNPNDKRNSIYSRAAAFERKIQIVLYESDQSTQKDSVKRYSEVVFDNNEHDFGELHQGEKAVYVFKFKNTGDADFVISGIEVSCSCITVDWSRVPVAPGESGEISIFMDTKDDAGSIAVTVTVLSNAITPKVVLTLNANVIEAENKQE
jgi:hypothetical protein